MPLRLLLIAVICVGSPFTFGKEKLRPELTSLFQSSLDFYNQLQRTPNGLYRDVWMLNPANQENNHLCSSAAIGIGLMALCIQHEITPNRELEKKALDTLLTLNGKNPAIRPEREPAGYFRHFFSDRDGKGKSEFSTIDTAIMVIGALYCRNTFKNPRIKQEADTLWHSIDWNKALAGPRGSQLYMVIENGNPVQNSRTLLFNEYYILAWLISEKQKQLTGKIDILKIPEMPSWKNRGVSLLGEPRKKPQSSFVIQFPYYMCHPCTVSPKYKQHLRAQAIVDQYYSSKTNGNAHWWGCGAGGTPDNGYHAATFADNPGRIVSPGIIAGFLPVFPQAEDHLIKLYRYPKRRLKTPVGDILPRFSIDQKEWRHHRVESIDFASMLFGLTAIHPELGMKFFEEKTRFTFGKTSD